MYPIMQLDSHLLPVNVILIFFRNLGEFIEILFPPQKNLSKVHGHK